MASILDMQQIEWLSSVLGTYEGREEVREMLEHATWAAKNPMDVALREYVGYYTSLFGYTRGDVLSDAQRARLAMLKEQVHASAKAQYGPQNSGADPETNVT